MDRRRFLTTVGGVSSVLTAGCSGWKNGIGAGGETQGLPTEFDDPGYATQFTPHGPWRMSGHDPRRTGHNAASKLPTGDVDAAWLRWIDGGRPTAPVTDDRNVYIGHTIPKEERHEFRGFISAFDGQTGEERWATELPPPAGTSTNLEGIRPEGMIRAGDNVYVAASLPDTRQTRIVALDADDGELMWEKTISGGLSTGPGTGENTLFVCISAHQNGDANGTNNGGLYAFSLDGSERWHRPVDSDIIQPVNYADRAVYAGLGDGRIIAVDSADGSVVWESLVVEFRGGGIPIQEPLLIDDERIYVLGSDRALHAISRADGSEIWNYVLQGARTGWRAPPALFDGTVYAGAAHGGLIALDAEEGDVRWQVEDAPVSGQIGVTDRGVVSGAGGTATAYDHTGESLWSFEMEVGEAPGDAGYAMLPLVTIAHNLLYVRLADGRLYALGARE